MFLVLFFPEPCTKNLLKINNMKKLLVILPLLIMSCQKNEAVKEKTFSNDSVLIADQKSMDQKMDSAANGNVALDENQALKDSFKSTRIIDGDSIVKTIDAAMLPLEFSDELTTDQSKLIVKIKNFKGKKIFGKITPENRQMNIRFNQIKLANGSYDGPFGTEISEDIDEPGELWLIIGKNLMVSGTSTGKFTMSLK